MNGLSLPQPPPGFVLEGPPGRAGPVRPIEDAAPPEIVSRFADRQPGERLLELAPQAGESFVDWYARYAQDTGLNPDPDPLKHQYDYFSWFDAMRKDPETYAPAIDPEDRLPHGASEFKLSRHPNRFVGGIDTKTGRPGSGARRPMRELFDEAMEDRRLAREQTADRMRQIEAPASIVPSPELGPAQTDEVIRAPSGEPFANEQAALITARFRGLSDYAPAQIPEGWVLQRKPEEIFDAQQEDVRQQPGAQVRPEEVPAEEVAPSTTEERERVMRALEGELMPRTSEVAPSSVAPRGSTAPQSRRPEPPEGFVIEEPGASLGQIPFDVAAGFNRGIAKGLGAPVDALNFVASLIGLGRDEPVGSSDNILRMLNAIGVGREPKNKAIGRAAQDVGMAAVPLGAVGAAVRAGRTGNMLTRPILEAFRRNPALFTTGELSAATSASIAGSTARAVAPGNVPVEIGAELAGGLLNPVGMGAAGGPRALRRIRRSLAPLLPGGAERSAARQLQQVVDDPQAAARALERAPDVVPGAELTPAQITQDPGLLRLERALIRVSADAEGKFAEAATVTNQALRAEARSIGDEVPIERTREFLEARLARLTELLDARVEQATQIARQKADALAPGASREELSRIVRQQLDKALADVRAQEKDLWALVPDEAKAGTRNLKNAFAEIAAARRKADDPEDIPKFVSLFLEGDKAFFANVETIGELQSFRSRLLRAIREERAKDAPNGNKIRILEQLQESALEDMGVLSATPGDVGEDVATALAFSRQLAERFRQGPVGRVLGFERTGAQTVAEGTTLDQIIGAQGTRGGEALDALMRATDTPETKGAVEEFIKDRFVLAVTDADGQVKPNIAERFLRNNRELLERFPGVRTQIQSAMGSEAAAQRITKSSAARRAGLLDKRRSRAALFLNAPVGKEINRVLNSRTPRENMRELVRQVRSDTTGEALKGLKTQAVDEIIGRAQIATMDLEGTPRLGARQLKDAIAKHGDALREILSMDEFMRLMRISNTVDMVERQAAAGRSLAEILDETPDLLIDLVSRIGGANIGARGAAGSTGAPIVAAGAGSRFVRALTNKIPVTKVRDVLAQAIFDKELMKTLLTKVSVPAERQALERRLNAYLINLFPTEEQEQPER